MTTRRSILTLLFAIYFLGSWSQSLSPADSLKLLATWHKTAHYLKTNDTIRLRTLCLDSIDCKLCGFRDDTITDTEKPLSIFFKDGLSNINSNQKLWKIINSEKPAFIVSGYIDQNGVGERIYGIAYLFWKPNEIAKSHEGGQVIFNYVLRQKDYKLTSITTVP